jgi:hypothetical protein
MIHTFTHLNNLFREYTFLTSFEFARYYIQNAKGASPEELAKMDSKIDQKIDQLLERWRDELITIRDTRTLHVEYFRQLSDQNKTCLAEAKGNSLRLKAAIEQHNERLHKIFERIGELKKTQGMGNYFKDAELKALSDEYLPTFDAGIDEETGLPKIIMVTNLIDLAYYETFQKKSESLLKRIGGEVTAALNSGSSAAEEKKSKYPQPIRKLIWTSDKQTLLNLFALLNTEIIYGSSTIITADKKTIDSVIGNNFEDINHKPIFSYPPDGRKRIKVLCKDYQFIDLFFQLGYKYGNSDKLKTLPCIECSQSELVDFMISNFVSQRNGDFKKSTVISYLKEGKVTDQLKTEQILAKFPELKRMPGKIIKKVRKI